jgi:anti-sigma B factor antagonist
MVLRLSGELDLEASPAVEPVIGAAIQSCSSVILDMSGLTFCDSSGIALLLRAYGRATRVGSQLELVRVQAAVARVLAAAGVDQVLPIAAG